MIIGYTSGVFDLFHQGHVNFLKTARSMCDKLIIGVTTDELSMDFKKKKPIVPSEERKSIVAAIRYVDLVIPQETMDKYGIWEQYKFDILFASQSPTLQWKSVEGEFLSHFKDCQPPRIIYLPYTPGISSSIRRSIVENL